MYYNRISEFFHGDIMKGPRIIKMSDITEERLIVLLLTY